MRDNAQRWKSKLYRVQAASEAVKRPSWNGSVGAVVGRLLSPRAFRPIAARRNLLMDPYVGRTLLSA